MLKQLGLLDTVTDLPSGHTAKNTAPDSSEATATVTASAGEDKGTAAENDDAVPEECVKSPTVSVVSKEQAMQLLKPKKFGKTAGPGRRPKSAETETGDSSLEGKFVNLVDLLLPVPIKGEFDVNKIKSSTYFFS